ADRPGLRDGAGEVELGDEGIVATAGGQRAAAQADRAGVEAGDDDALAGRGDRAQAVEVGAAEQDGVEQGAAGARPGDQAVGGAAGDELAAADVDSVHGGGGDRDPAGRVDRDTGDRVVGLAAEALDPAVRAGGVELGDEAVGARRAFVE